MGYWSTVENRNDAGPHEIAHTLLKYLGRDNAIKYARSISLNDSDIGRDYQRALRILEKGE